MLSVKNCSFTYPGQSDATLHDVTVDIPESSFLAIIGANGSGKSTLCKLFNGIIPHFFVGDLTGEIHVNGIDTIASDVATLSAHVGYVYQDFENSIVRATVYDEVSYAPLNYGFDDFHERSLRALEILEISHLKDERIWQLSGGQKHLVALAAVLAVDPQYIIVDEPVAQLDPFHARQTYEMLKKLDEVYGKTIIVIEHHTEFIANYCTDVLLMEDGRVSWIKPVEEALQAVDTLVAAKIHPPQVTQLAAALNPSHQLESEASRMIYPIRLDEAVDYFADYSAKALVHRNRNLIHPKTERKRSLLISNVSAQYRDYQQKRKLVLDQINLEFFEGERIAIVGNNGAGKSTLMRLIARLMKPSQGSIEVMGEDIAERSPEELANLVSFIYQNPEEMFIDDSIYGDVAYFMRARGVDQYEEKVQSILDHLELSAIQERDARLLSGGQQRRVSLAIGMGMTPKIILLDEPTASLDIGSKRELLKMLDLLKHNIRTTIVATHDMQLVADWASRVVVLSAGRVIFDGIARDLFKEKEVMEKANLIVPQVVDLSLHMGLDPLCLSVDEMRSRIAPSLPKSLERKEA